LNILKKKFSFKIKCIIRLSCNFYWNPVKIFWTTYFI